MSTARVTNNTEVPLLVGGVSVQPGRSVKIKDWHQHEGSDNVVAWLAAEAITVEVLNAKGKVVETLPAEPAETKDAVQPAKRS
ncbi:MAG TPA: hypothetical protein VIL30_14605 [Ramlibacter sp.]